MKNMLEKFNNINIGFLLLLIFCLFMCCVCIVTATVICITVTNIVDIVINLLSIFLNFCLFISYSYWVFTMLID